MSARIDTAAEREAINQALWCNDVKSLLSLLGSFHAALDEIDRLTAALAEAEDRGAAQMRERAAKTALGQAAADGLVDDTRLIAATLAIRALPLREPGATP